MPVFGIGGSEIIVILIVALLFLGPDKLPDAAKMVSKGIRDLKKQQRALQQTIENDEQIGGAIRDLKSALRGEEEPAARRPPVRKEPPKVEGGDTEAAVETPHIMPPGHDAEGRLLPDAQAHDENAGHDPDDPGVPDRLKLPPTAGEADRDVANGKSEGDDELAKLVKPAVGSIAKDPPPVPRATKLPPPRSAKTPSSPIPSITKTPPAGVASVAASDEPETVKARPSSKSKTDG